MRISVIVPVYNHAEAVRQAVSSLFAQTRVPDEVIVVDDGSADDPAAGLAEFGAALRILRRPNGGPAAARNTGLSVATGDAVAFLDADDSFTPTSIETRARYLAEHPEIDAVFGSLRSADGSAEPALLPGGLLVRRSFLDRVGPFDEELRAGEFIEWISRARASGLREACIPDIVLIRNSGRSDRHASGNGAAFVLLARKLIERRRDGDR